MSDANGQNLQLSDSASSTSDNKIKYQPIGEWARIEYTGYYNKGGFHPVHIGDVLDGRFEVVHKLGNGGFSTVWLCLDTTNQRWRALKIMTADHSSNGRDITIVEHLQREASPKQLEDCHIAVPLEKFWIQGSNGRHLCFVTDVYGWDVSLWSIFLDPVGENPAITINNVCLQIVEGLRFLHSKGVSHGDLRPANVLMKLRSLDGLTKEQMLELTGEPELIELETVSGEDPQPHAPKYCVRQISEEWCKTLISDSVVIGDFGESFHAQNPPLTTGIPELYAAPEILLEGVPGPASDIWSLACTIYEIKTHDILFASYWGSGMSKILEVIRSYIGPLPEPYKSVYRRKLAEYYGRDPGDASISDSGPHVVQQSAGVEGATTEPSTQNEDRPCPFEEALREERHYYREVPNSEHLPQEQKEELIIYRYPEEEVLMLADLLKEMLRYDPAKRICIEAVFRHPWFKRARNEKSPAESPKSIWTLGLSLLSLGTFSRRYLPGYMNWKSG
ncbi:kinase-like protein [Hypoxylon sp. NC0597]|nr:kinase-like protein [Hypoxylon sp. NC0597]